MSVIGRTHRRPPPTKFGYQPPEGATATTWRCTGEEGGRMGEWGESDPARWPRRCPECGSRLEPQLDEPWAHEARRMELDARVLCR